MADTYYFAAFLPTVEGGYVVQFPDIPEAFTQGDSLEEALAMAGDVLKTVIEEYAAARMVVPPSTGPAGAKRWLNENSHEEGIDPSGEFHIQAFPLPKTDMTPVRINISLPKSVLEEVDRKAAQHSMTRSGFLSKAAMEYQESNNA